MNKPLVSICCITFNQKAYIKDCIDGFLMQKTNFNFEILIHDDASTDGTQEIISEYELKYPNLIKAILQLENQYSKGIKPLVKYIFPIAQGKYIALCEGDDYWTDPFKLQKQVDFLETNPHVGLVHTDASIYFEDSGVLIQSNNQRLNRSIPQGNIFTDLINGNFIQTLTVVKIGRASCRERV